MNKYIYICVYIYHYNSIYIYIYIENINLYMIFDSEYQLSSLFLDWTTHAGDGCPMESMVDPLPIPSQCAWRTSLQTGRPQGPKGGDTASAAVLRASPSGAKEWQLF